MKRTEQVPLTGFCNPSWRYGIGRADFDASHRRCHASWCRCVCHLFARIPSLPESTRVQILTEQAA